MKSSGSKLLWFVALVWNGIVLSQHFAAAQAQNDIDAARALWQSLTKGMPSDYTFEYLETAEDVGFVSPYVVDVRNDTVTRVYPREIANFDDPILDPSDFPTIPDLFDIIQEAINDAMEDPMVQYNTKYGYPNLISIRNTETDATVITVSALTPYTVLEYELDSNVALWDSYEDETEAYSYVTQAYCFCEPSYISPKFIEVENNTIVSTTDLETGAPSDFTYETIPALFSRIQQAINSHHVSIDVSYDETYGYPSIVSTNPEYNIMDAGISIQISNVTLTGFVLDEQSAPPTTLAPTESPPTGKPLGLQWCFGIFKFTAWCRQRNAV